MPAGRYLEKLCKWRTVFAGWQLGTRLLGDPESDAVRDHREVTMLLRAEVNALSRLLISKGVLTAEELTAQLETEAYVLDQAYEQKFPGWQSTDQGMAIVDFAKAAATMRGWKP